MKNNYIFLLVTLFCFSGFSQVKCSDADSDVNYAYSHVKSSYDSNNISDLKYFAERSLKAFERAKENLKACGCSVAYGISVDGIELLEKVEFAESFEDGRFYVKRARERASELIGELDQCNQISLEEEELLDLEMEQTKLQEKQKELEQKQEELRMIMEEQRQKEIRLQKEVLITNYEAMVSSNLQSINQTLSTCGCDASITNDSYSVEKLYNLTEAQIKSHYIELVKNFTKMYLNILEKCDSE